MKRVAGFRFAVLALCFLATGLGIFRSVDGVDASIGTSSQIEPNTRSRDKVSAQGGNAVYFEENRGQLDRRVKYMTRGAGTQMFLTATESVYVLRNPERSSEDRVRGTSPLVDRDSVPKAVAVYMRLAGANPAADFVPSQQLQHHTNYFRGDSGNGRAGIPNFGGVTAHDIYNGVDIVWQGKHGGEVQYDFLLSPGADASQIEWEIEGAKNVLIDASGALVVETEAGVMSQTKPFSFQEVDGIRSEVTSGFSLAENTAAGAKVWRAKFTLGDYDRSKPLTIDPTMGLAGSTFLGGSARDEARAIAVDSAGNIYMAGFGDSNAFPTTPGSFDPTYNGLLDAFVTKLSPDCSTVIYSAFLGGNSDDLGYGVAVDAAGNAYVTGYTGGGAPGFPTTTGSFDTTFNGGYDVFVTKLNPAGSSLVYSTLIGGGGLDVGKGIVLDAVGNAFVPGLTDGGTPAYPTTGGAFDTSHNGQYDVFVTKLNAAGTALIYSTFVGGSLDDAAEGIAVDGPGNAFITGYAISTNFPTTGGAYDTSHNGAVDVFTARLNASGSSLLYSTFIGGDNDELAFGIGIDASGNAMITGRTTDGTVDYPTTAGAFDTTHNGFLDVFVTKLNSLGSALVYSTFLGGVNDDFANGINVDIAGNATVTGRTDGAGYPVTAGAYDTSQNGADDIFVTKVNTAGTALVSSTYLGGSNDDVGFGITSDALGNTYVSGWTAGGTPAYPTTATAFDTSHNGGNDVFVAKLSQGSTAFDFDGDRKTDLGIFRPSPPTGAEWWINRSSNGGNFATQFGVSSDTIAPADFTGDGRTDVAFFRPSTGTWFVLRSEDNSFYSFPFGANGDFPIPADYDADGKADAAVFRPSTVSWFINKSTGGTEILSFGAPGDLPVVADYDGDARADIAIYRPNAGGGEWWLRRSSSGVVFATVFGMPSDRTVQGDYTGDGKADIAFWRPSTGNWFILRSEDLSFYAFAFGANGDVPAPGDYDGDAKNDAAVFRPSSSTWFANRSSGGTLIQTFGISGDVPLPSAYVR